MKVQKNKIITKKSSEPILLNQILMKKMKKMLKFFNRIKLTPANQVFIYILF